MSDTPRLILGSGSPRRLELLAQIGITPHAVRPPDIDETPGPGEQPRPYVRRMARQKVAATDCRDDDIVLCADTTVALGRRILGQPVDADEAERFLRLLSGRRHTVMTAVAVRRGETIRLRDVVSTCRMKRLSDAEIADVKERFKGYGLQDKKPANDAKPAAKPAAKRVAKQPAKPRARAKTAAKAPAKTASKTAAKRPATSGAKPRTKKRA